MESGTGSTEPPVKECPSCESSSGHKLYCPDGGAATTPVGAWLKFFVDDEQQPPQLSMRETLAIGRGEPYCFTCGKPASSFPEYANRDMYGDGSLPGDPATYVTHEEGTYNPGTNRFACDACYIAIGMPVGPPQAPGGLPMPWRAP